MDSGHLPAPAVVCLDFDGTLVDPSGRIHPSDVAILRAGAPATIVPATGRPLHAVRSTLRRHGLFPDRPLPFPLVLENGAVVYDADETVRARFTFDPDVQRALMDAMLATPAVTFLLFATDTATVLWPSVAGDRMIERFSLQATPFAAGPPAPELTKILAIAGSDEPLRDFSSRTRALDLERAFSLPTVLELTRARIDKGTGLDVLLGDLPAATMVAAAGDGENDLPLFERAGVTFAPADCPPAIRARADHVVDVAHDGLLAPVLRTLEGLSRR